VNLILIGKGSILYNIAQQIIKDKTLNLKIIFWDKNSNNKSDIYYLKNLKKLHKVTQISNINMKKNVNLLKYLNFDYLLSINNTQIFKNEILKLFKNKLINYHYSLIPSYKGLYSCTKVILKQERYTGISWHVVTNKIDQGRVIFQKKQKIHRNDNAANLIVKLNSLCVKTFFNFINNIKKAKFSKNKNLKIRDFKLKIKDEKYSKISLLMKADKMLSVFNAFSYFPFVSPLPPVKIKLNKIFKIKNIDLMKNKKSLKKKYTKISKDRFIIRSADNKFLLLECL